MQSHAAVTAEHGHGFGDMVERLGLYLDERIVPAIHVQPFGDIVVKIRDPALRVRRGDHPQRASVRQMPHVLLRFDGSVRLVQLLFPLPEILLLRQLAFAA